MRVRLALLLLAAAAAVVRSDEAPAPGTQTTTVKGAPPALGGLWLAVANLSLKGRTKNTVAFWDVEQTGERVVLTERFVELPAAERAAMEAADAAGQPWTPSPETIARVAAEWDRLPARDVGLRSVEHEIIVPEEFDAILREEPGTKDALWVVRQRYAFDPSATAAARQENVWAGIAATRDGYRANVIASTVAAAPFPIPLAFTGTGTLYRLEEESPGILDRLAGVLRGCGRK